MQKVIRIGTRESRLALWQATLVSNLLANHGIDTELVPIKSEGDTDLQTPLYEMGVQGIFTRSLDIALINHSIDIAVHSMKDVPTQLAQGVMQCAVLPRGPVHDLLVFKTDGHFLEDPMLAAHIATGSIRRKAQWLHKYPKHHIHNLRGNVQTRLQKLETEPWNAAIFALAGLDRLNLRPANSMVLEWMLPAPAQGAILVACREEDVHCYEACRLINDAGTELCTKIERDFLRGLMGGCSTPISALAEIEEGEVYFSGNILSPDGEKKASVENILPIDMATNIGKIAAAEILNNGGQEIADSFRTSEK